MTKINETFLAMEYSILELTHITKENVEYEITAKQKIIYCYLCSLSRTFDTVYPSLEGMAKRLGFTSEQIVRREIKQLIKMGLVAKEAKTGCTNRYTVFPITQDNPPESIHAGPVEDVKPISNAIPQVVIEEPTQSDTEAYSGIKSFCTTSEEAYQDESETSQESSDYNYMEDEEKINAISIKDKDHLIARANQFYANHAVGDSENTLSSLLISEMNIEGVHLDFVMAHFRQEKRAFTERFKQENKCHELNQEKLRSTTT